MLTDYSTKDLKAYTPEVLDEEPEEVVHARLRAVTAMCINHTNLEADIMSSPAYSALRKGVYSTDPYVRLLSLRALAALARNSRDVRKRIATTMDFVRLSSEISSTSDVLEKMADSKDPGFANSSVATYLILHKLTKNDALSNTQVSQAMLAYAFDDVVAAAAFHTDAHPKMLQIGYVERAVKMVKSANYSIRCTAIRAIAGLTRTIEGRQALARTDIFPELYNLIYQEETRDKLLQPNTVNFAKFAMQQLLLSESALDIMLPRYEPFFHAMTRDAKEDMLMKFDLLDETEYAKAYDLMMQGIFGFGFGAIYGALRSMVTSTWVPGMAKPQHKLSSIRKIIIGAANGSTGSIPLIALYLLVTQVTSTKLVSLKDSEPTFWLATAAFAGVIAPTIAVVLNVFPHSLVPAIVGINAKHILSAIPGTWEHEQTVALLQEKEKNPTPQQP